MNATPHPAIGKVSDIQTLIHKVFQDSSLGATLERHCQTTLTRIQDVDQSSRYPIPVIAIMGAKNTGKSWLCRQLITDPKKREQISSGRNLASSTLTPVWIGNEAPAIGDAELESRIPAHAEQMEGLGSPYALLDLPGYNEVGPAVQTAALRALDHAPWRVMMFTQETLGDESQFQYLKESYARPVLPVVSLAQFPASEETRADIAQLVLRMKSQCPTAMVLEPIVLPDLSHAADPAAAREIAHPRILEGLRSLLRTELPRAHNPIDRELDLLRRNLRGALTPFLRVVEPSHENLVAAENQQLKQLIGRLLGSEEQCELSLVTRMRWASFSHTSPVFFPHHSFVGFCAVTFGAWSNLAFAMSGSLPSLAALAFKSFRNVKNASEKANSRFHALRQRFHNMAEKELQPLYQGFYHAVVRSLELPESRTDAQRLPAEKMELVGLETLTERSAEIFSTAVQKHSKTGARISNVCGLLSLVLFVALLAGPAWAIYREFLDVWHSSFRAGTGRAITWQDFPIPTFSMLSTSLVLCLLPSGILAFVTSILSTPKKERQAATQEVMEAHQRLGKELAEKGTLRVVSKDPLRMAVRELLDFIREIEQLRRHPKE